MAVIYTVLTRLLHKDHVTNNKNEIILQFHEGSDDKLRINLPCFSHTVEI